VTTPVFPYLPGLGWPVTRSPGDFDTVTQVAMSGKEVRFANRTQARYKYELVVESLSSNSANANLVAQSKQTLEGFFNQCLGGALIFNYWDVDDCQVTAQEFSVGDGVTTSFQLGRASGGWVDLIFAPLNQAGPVVVPNPNGAGTINAPYPAPLIYDNSSLVSSANYTITNGLVAFNYAPTSGHALTWTGNFYWPCNFDDDTLALAKFMGGLWEAKSIKFTSRVF
jgi:hypothetical protein